jgi:hypothetical protein
MSEEEQQCINEQGKQFRCAIKAYHQVGKFEIDAYIIKKTKEIDYAGNSYWSLEKYGQHDTVRKYKIVGLDEYGIPFYKKVLHNGKLCDHLKYMGNLDLRFYQFHVDPDMQDYILLGGDIKDYKPIALRK